MKSKSRNLIAILLAMIITGLLIVPGCTEDVTVIIKPTKPVITRTVSFSKDIVPVFTTKCALTGCHAVGAHTPVLTADKAYSSLMNDPKFIKINDPASSQLYQRLTGSLLPGMPLTAPGSDPSTINELVLAWIKQGAKNN